MQAIVDGPVADLPLLTILGLTKTFPGTLALDSVGFEVRRGEIHALLGQNGAGKSTLIKILAGVYEPTHGEIRLNGLAVTPSVEKLPINFLHQDLGLVDSMTVAENVAIYAGFPRRLGLIDWRETLRAAAKALATMTDDIHPATPVGDLSAAEKSIVAIARALTTRCDLLVLDEPTASLPEEDVSHLFVALERLRAAGLGIIYVSHRLDEVSRIADRVTILRDGRRVVTESIKAMSADRMVSMIVGRELAETEPAPPLNDQSDVFTVEELRSGAAGPVSFSIKPGETLALVGLRGAGHDVIARAIFGNLPVQGGRMVLRGAELSGKGEDAAIRAGIGFISSKRAEESMAPALSVRENIFINPALTGTAPMSWMSHRNERTRAAQVVRRYSIRPSDCERIIATLSGGNQQKAIVARWLEGTVNLLILEEPTTGVDVGSKAEIYDLLQKSLSRGMAVLLVSSDFEEVARISHRALVFSRGRVVATLDRAGITVSRLTTLAAAGEETNRLALQHA